MSRKIIIDTDPGQDDAVAILLALASPEELDVLGIVTVAGNVELNQTTRNALQTVELSGRTDVPVYAGCARPMRQPLITAKYVHGDTGLDGPDLPAPQMKAEEQHGVDFIIEALRSNPANTVTLCTLGPLTNIGMAFVKAPDIVERVERIVMMGGAYFEVGNTTPAAEFNIYVDPEAADLVMRSGVPITLATLDVTHKVLTTKDHLEQIRAIGKRAATATVEMLDFFERFDREKYGWDGGPLHDPCVIAWLLKPELFGGRDINVEIETGSELTRGMTVADYWGIMDKPANVHFLDSVDATGFFALLAQRLERLP
ncbi:nucleoside hydrolase [Cucumibacter marinus]|uniref:nucleoside hydrolase n=1 Tax=Cucumibacter marinus TaxID=1121252 RepID=UPI000407104D|nr:nucleoside hydrolase [Cucumibacter marinus]